jgi:hypothetical protein
MLFAVNFRITARFTQATKLPCSRHLALQIHIELPAAAVYRLKLVVIGSYSRGGGCMCAYGMNNMFRLFGCDHLVLKCLQSCMRRSALSTAGNPAETSWDCMCAQGHCVRPSRIEYGSTALLTSKLYSFSPSPAGRRLSSTPRGSWLPQYNAKVRMRLAVPQDELMQYSCETCVRGTMQCAVCKPSLALQSRRWVDDRLIRYVISPCQRGRAAP